MNCYWISRTIWSHLDDRFHSWADTSLPKSTKTVLYNFRQNISERAKYYGLCFMSQIILDNEDSGVATALINIYISFFKASVKMVNIDTYTGNVESGPHFINWTFPPPVCYLQGKSVLLLFLTRLKYLARHIKHSVFSSR